jgi:hypothetical protein
LPILGRRHQPRHVASRKIGRLWGSSNLKRASIIATGRELKNRTDLLTKATESAKFFDRIDQVWNDDLVRTVLVRSGRRIGVFLAWSDDNLVITIVFCDTGCRARRHLVLDIGGPRDFQWSLMLVQLQCRQDWCLAESVDD